MAHFIVYFIWCAVLNCIFRVLLLETSILVWHGYSSEWKLKLSKVAGMEVGVWGAESGVEAQQNTCSSQSFVTYPLSVILNVQTLYCLQFIFAGLWHFKAGVNFFHFVKVKRWKLEMQEAYKQTFVCSFCHWLTEKNGVSIRGCTSQRLAENQILKLSWLLLHLSGKDAK